MASSPWAERLAAALGSDLPWQALDDDPELAEGVAIEVVAIFETGVPVGRFAEHVIELDRAFRYAARAAENEEDIADLLARGGRPLFVDEGLELTAVMPGSIRFPLIPSERIKEVLDSNGLRLLLASCSLLGGANVVVTTLDGDSRGEVERPVAVPVLVEQHEEAVADKELPVGEFPRLTAGMEIRHPAPRVDVQITRDGETVILRIRPAP